MPIVLTRLVAFMLDWVVLFLVFVAPQGVIALFWNDWPMNNVDNGFRAWGWVVLTVSIPSWVYFTLSDSSVGGATVGKKITNLAVRSEESTTLPRSSALVRTAVKLLSWELTHIMIFLPEPFGETLTPFKVAMIVVVNTLMLVWLVVPFLDRRQRAVHDRLAASQVVSTE